jgi:hypothetical protein
MAAAPQVSRLKYRPFFPRRPYGTGYGGGGGGGGGAFEAGTAAGKQVGSLIEAIGKMQAKAKQDQIANQLMNAKLPPRAALVSPGVNPQTGATNVVRAGINTTGGPMTGGMNELEARVQAQRLINELNNQGTARAAASLGPVGPGAGVSAAWKSQGWRGGGRGGGGGGRAGGGAGGGGAAGGKAGKPTPYQAGTEANPNNYDMDKLHTDFDHAYYKGAYDQMSPHMGDINPAGTNMAPGVDEKGHKIPGQTGFVQDGKGGLKFYEDGTLKANIAASDLPHWQARVNTARYNIGLDPVNMVPLTPANPDSKVPVGHPDNPIVANNQWDISNVPYGSVYKDPNGNLRTRWSLQQKQDIQFAGENLSTGAGQGYTSSMGAAAEPSPGGVDLSQLGPEQGPSGYGASMAVAQGGMPVGTDTVSPSNLPSRFAPPSGLAPEQGPSGYSTSAGMERPPLTTPDTDPDALNRAIAASALQAPAAQAPELADSGYGASAGIPRAPDGSDQSVFQPGFNPMTSPLTPDQLAALTAGGT